MRFFRFHLSTAIIVSLASGWLMGINLLPNSYFRQEIEPGEWQEQLSRYGVELHQYTILTDHYGWPCLAASHQHDAGDSLVDTDEWKYHRRAIVFDALTALVFLLSVAPICEVAPRLLNRLYGDERTLEFKPNKS